MSTSLDLADNISALVAAICYQNYLTVEGAFELIEGKITVFKPTEQDKQDMCSLRDQGMTYAAIGELYGIDYTRVYKIIKRYKEKKTLQGGNLSKVKG